MAIEYNSPIRAPRPASSMELREALGLDARSTSDQVARELSTLQDKAKARLDIAGSAYLPSSQKLFEKVWGGIRGNLEVPTGGILFGPSFEVRRPTDLASLKELHQFLAPLTEVSQQEAQQILALEASITQGLLTGPPPKQQTQWRSSVYQATRMKEGSRGFLSQEELEVFTKLAHRPKSEHVQVGARLGRTNLVWKKLDGKWEPCFENSRYKRPRSLLDLPPAHLKASMHPENLPEDFRAAAQQRDILARALNARTNNFGDESGRRMKRAELRSALLREFPPEGPKVPPGGR
jgi:hypothetical protein